MGKYVKMFKNRLAAGLQYRANIVGSMLLDLLSLGSTLILWTAIFSENAKISNFNTIDAVLYFLFIPVIGAFTFVFVSDELGREIRQGFLTNYLLKPQNLVIDALTRALASKVNYISTTLPVYIIIILLVSGIFSHKLPITFFTVLLTLITVIIGFFLHFFMDITITWLAFWVGDIWAFYHFKRAAFLIFGGMMYPLDFAPQSIKTIIDLLPFKYLYYVPNSYLLGKRGAESLLSDFLAVVFWIGLFFCLEKLLWRFGLKKYEAYGG